MIESFFGALVLFLIFVVSMSVAAMIWPPSPQKDEILENRVKALEERVQIIEEELNLDLYTTEIVQIQRDKSIDLKYGE